MKKIIRYCDECGKQTTEFLKINFYKTSSKVNKSISFDLCNDCALKRLERSNIK